MQFACLEAAETTQAAQQMASSDTVCWHIALHSQAFPTGRLIAIGQFCRKELLVKSVKCRCAGGGAACRHRRRLLGLGGRLAGLGRCRRPGRCGSPGAGQQPHPRPDSWAQMEFKLGCGGEFGAVSLLVRLLQFGTPKKCISLPPAHSTAPGATGAQLEWLQMNGTRQGVPRAASRSAQPQGRVFERCMCVCRHHTTARRLFMRSVAAAKAIDGRGLHTHVTWARQEMHMANHDLVCPLTPS